LFVDEKELKGLKLSPMWKDHVSSGGQNKAVDPSVALAELRDFVGDLPFVCHNASFDKCVLENEIEKVSHRWTPKNQWICTLVMARRAGTGSFVGYSPGRDDGMSYKLEHVAEALGLVFDRSQLHLGYYDAEIAGTIFLKLHYLRNIPIQTVQ
jgi:DNA polymerase III epsilon subunit-like protein